jgi:hypothetical protein
MPSITDTPSAEALLEAVLADPVQAASACRHRGVAAAALRALAERLEAPAVRLFLALCPDTPTRVIESLSADLAGAVAERQALAAHARTPPAALAALAADPDVAVRQAAASNAALAPGVAARLVHDPGWRVRQALALNPAVPARLQRLLLVDAVSLVRSALLSQPRLDPETFAALAADSDPAVRAAAVLDRRVPEALLLAWADSDDPLLQALLQRRPDLPEAVCESLCFSTHAAVQRQAVASRQLALDELVGWCREGNPELRADLAARPDLVALGFDLLAADPEPAVRAVLAGNPELPPAQAAALAADPSLEVRLALVGNPALAPPVLLCLLQRDDPETRTLAAGRADLSAVHLDLILGSADDAAIYPLARAGTEYTELPALSAQRLQAHRLPTLRALAAPSRHLTGAMLAALAADPAPEVRYRLCANPALTADLLRRLAVDPDPRVAERARSRPLPAGRRGSPTRPLAGTPSVDDRPPNPVCRRAFPPSVPLSHDSTTPPC